MIAVVVHLRQSLERLLNVLALHGTALKEFKADLLGELLAIMRVDHLSRLQVCLVRYDNAGEVAALVLLLYLLVPRSQQIERVGVCAVVDQYNLVSLAHEVVSDLLENVLTSDVDHVKLNVSV